MKRSSKRNAVKIANLPEGLDFVIGVDKLADDATTMVDMIIAVDVITLTINLNLHSQADHRGLLRSGQRPHA